MPTTADFEWHDPGDDPAEPGWYEVTTADDRFGPELRYRAWGNGLWWIPLRDGWVTAHENVYRWRGPVADINGPAPDGTNPQPARTDR